MGLKKKINEKLLRDGEQIFADASDLSFVLIFTFMAAWFTKMVFTKEGFFNFSSSFDTIPLIEMIYYVLAASTLFFLTYVVYYHLAWFRYKKVNPEAEGPYFKAAMPNIRKWPLIIALIASILYPDSLDKKMMFENPPLWGVFMLISGCFSAILIAELLRTVTHERPWSNNKHFIVLLASLFIIVSVRIVFFIQTDAYSNYKYGFY